MANFNKKQFEGSDSPFSKDFDENVKGTFQDALSRVELTIKSQKPGTFKELEKTPEGKRQWRYIVENGGTSRAILKRFRVDVSRYVSVKVVDGNGKEYAANHHFSANERAFLVETTEINRVRNYREKPVDLGYREINKEHLVKISLPSRGTPEGRAMRCLRRKPITDAAEKRYGIPHGLLLAMMAQEGYGDPTIPNLNGDGGLGLIHIQAANAHTYGLKTLPRFTTRMKDYAHGRKISELLKKTHDIKLLIAEDDRFHPVLAVDAAARFLVSKYKQVRSKYHGPYKWIRALVRYSGRGEDKYAFPVLRYRNLMNTFTGYTLPPFSHEDVSSNDLSKIVMHLPHNKIKVIPMTKAIADTKNAIESVNIKIGGKRATYEEYLDYNEKQCYNYDLEKYEKIGTYLHK